jgi:hypothetical protein
VLDFSESQVENLSIFFSEQQRGIAYALLGDVDQISLSSPKPKKKISILVLFCSIAATINLQIFRRI